MMKCLSCESDIDSGNVECRFADGTLLSIDCDAVEDTLEITTFFKGANRIGLDRIQCAEGLCAASV